MRSCKRLKNINSVSGKLGERHIDPFLLVVKDRFGEVQVANRTDSLGRRRLVKSREAAS